MANTYITRTPSSAGNRRKFTISMWVKRVKLGVDQWLVQAGASGSEFDIRFTTSDTLRFSTWDGSNGYGMITTRVFRDTSAWYHLVFQYDTAQATDTNRNKIYINGEQINPSDTSAYNAGKHPPQNYDNPSWNNTTAFRINDVTWTSSSPKDAVYSHIHHTDGYAYDASTFGSTDSTTGEWKINTSPSITMGTNGFTILKDGNTITDQSTNSNNFTLGAGTLTNTEDCPSNVFATYNPLDNYFANSTFTNGNTTVATNTSNTTYNTTTLGIPPTMKCYWEVKFNSLHSANGEVGIVDAPTVGSSAGANRLYYQSFGISVNDGGQIWSNNSNTNITLGTLATSDIVCFAWDGVNQALYVRKNGDAWINSGDPTSGASKTGTVKSFTGTRTMFPAVGDQAGNHSVSTSTNFGNGYFATTAVSSAGTNASGNGIFEYDTPTGYTALSTKGLNL